MHHNALGKFVLILSLLLAQAAIAADPAPFNRMRAQFILEMSEKHGFDPASLTTLLNQAKYRQKIIDAISRPAEGMPWHRYRPIFLSGSRAKQGLKFWQENKPLLQQAEQRYGVPAHIIVAIIGVETRYGRHSGGYPVLDALSTLAFTYPKRAAFFRKELEHFLLLTREENIDPAKAVGSYAGAMGQPQFIPSSYRSYAVDFDNDGQRNLWDSKADVIGSVAAYFKRHGWRKDAPITQQVSGVSKEHKAFIKAGMKPSLTIGQLRAANIQINSKLPDQALTSLIRLEGKKKDEYWLGLHNFYVITRYNHSNLYAMAVYQLSQEILTLRQAGG